VLAILQLADGHHAAAIKSARKAVKLGPGRADAYLDLGLVLAYSGEPKQGIEQVETAMRLSPKPAPNILLYAGIVFFIDAQYQRAVETLSKAQDDPLGNESLWIYLAAAYTLLNQKEEAAKAITKLLELYPNMNTEYIRARDSYFRQTKDLDRLLLALDAAGLPNWPFDFQGQESNQIKELELSDVVEDKTWIGKHSNGTEFFQQVRSSGSLAYRSKNTILTGTASIQNNMLCQRFDGATLNKDMCGYIYHNPDGSVETRDKYIVVMPDTLRYFSVAD